MDARLAPSDLFGDAANAVVDRYQEANKQATIFQRFLSRRSRAPGAAGREQPPPQTSSSYRETQKQSVASRAPPQRGIGQRRHSVPRTARSKSDLRAVIQARNSLAKKS